jgi:hypothetical protein
MALVLGLISGTAAARTDAESATPAGLDGVDKYPALLAELARRLSTTPPSNVTLEIDRKSAQ